MNAKLLEIKVRENTLNDIDKLQKRLHAPGRSDTIRRSIEITSTLADAISKGDRLIIEGKKGDRRQVTITGLKEE